MDNDKSFNCGRGFAHLAPQACVNPMRMETRALLILEVVTMKLIPKEHNHLIEVQARFLV